MRTLDFTCDCGQGRFISGTDNLSYMAHFIPDQDYDAFSGRVDDAIEKSGPTAEEKAGACMEWRRYAMGRLWQCYACGSVYIEGPDGSHHRFVPATGDIPKGLFKRL